MAKKVNVRTTLGLTEQHEKEVHRALEENLEAIEPGLRVVDSFVPTPVGVINTLAIDQWKRLVIVEHLSQLNSHSDAMIRALDYCAWTADPRNLSYLTQFVQRQAGEALSPGESLNLDSRLIMVAHEFEERVLRAAMNVAPDVTLVTFRLFPWGDDELGLVLEKILEKRKGEAKPEAAATKASFVPPARETAAFEAPYEEMPGFPTMEEPVGEVETERPLGVAGEAPSFEAPPVEELVEESLSEPPPTFHEIRLEPVPSAPEELDQPLAGRPVEESLEVQALERETPPEGPLFVGFGEETTPFPEEEKLYPEPEAGLVVEEGLEAAAEERVPEEPLAEELPAEAPAVEVGPELAPELTMEEAAEAPEERETWAEAAAEAKPETDVYPPVFEEIEEEEAPLTVSLVEPPTTAEEAVAAEAAQEPAAVRTEALPADALKQFESLREEFKEDFAAYRNYLERRLDQQMDELEAAVERRLSMPVDQLVQEARRRMPMGRTYFLMAVIAAVVSAAVGYALLNLP